MTSRKNRLYTYLAVLVSLLLLAGYTTTLRASKKSSTASAREEVLLKTVMAGLSQAHYDPEKLDDAFSGRVYKLYLKNLYKSHRFLLQPDLNQIDKYKKDIDDEVKRGSQEFYELTTKLYTQRVKEVHGYVTDILSKPFDFTKNEAIELDDEKVTVAGTPAESREQWRKYLKYQVMVQLAQSLESQQRAKEGKAATDKKKPDTTADALDNADDAGDDEVDDSPVAANKSVTELEADARAKVGKLYTDLFRRMGQQNSSDNFTLYMNSITNTYDPHTEYFPPKDKANFDIQMTGRLEGIGATLQEKEGEIKVNEIVPGSPAYRQGELKAGYVIQRVAQGKGEPVSIEGMRLDEAILLIRGKKGTEVRLTVRKPDGSVTIIPIVRDVVIIAETYAQSNIIEQDGKRIGYLRLPSFYADFSRSGGRNSADDVRKELAKLTSENVQGVILDLRNNGGGSLSDAVDMSGLFFDEGPVVQVKSSGGGIGVLADHDERVQYGGPLVVMVNSYSASASEILAAAMQDYKRAVIVGSNTTYGKGTVQRIFDLDDALPAEFNNIKPMGSLKLTTQKFYRINGGATQLRGVTPDIVLPDTYAYLDQGEKETAYPLPWDEIKPASFKTWSSPSIAYSKLQNASKSRVSANPVFQTINGIAQRLKKQSDNTSRSLKLADYQNEQAVAKSDSKRYDELEKQIKPLSIRQMKVDRDMIKSDTVQVARADQFTKKLTKDVYLQEAVSIVRDMM